MKLCITGPLTFTDEQMDRLKSFGELKRYASLPSNDEELIQRLSGCEIAVVSWCKVNAQVLSKCPTLKMISLTAAGHDHIDVAAAKQMGIEVAAAKGAGAVAVAEFALSAALNLNRRLLEAHNSLREGRVRLSTLKGHDLSSLVVGVVGAGAIASHVIRLFRSLGSKVICYTLNPSPQRAVSLGVNFVSLDDLLQNSDVITLHVPLTSETNRLFSRERLERTKRGVLVVNTARGKIIDTQALLDLLAKGHIGGAALDVFEEEPPIIPSEWFSLPNLILTPHTAFNTGEATDEKIALCIENIAAFLNGTPQNLVG